MNSKLVPKLRFKEFSGEWEEKKLGEVINFFDGKRKPIKESDRANMQGEYPYYGASGIIDYVNDYIFDEDLILLGEDGENIISRNLPLVFKVSGKSWINNHAHVLKPISSYNLDFLVQYLETLSYVKYNSGGAQPKLNQAVCKIIPLIIPKSPKEQQKIASTLSSLDKLIEAQSKKVEALKKHKKGLMQKLFPQEGEKKPNLRFKEFSGEWEEKTLKSISNITTGNSNREDSTKDKGKYTFFDRSEDIRTSHRYLFNDEAIIIAGEGQKFTPKYYKGKFDLHQRTYAILELQIIGRFLYYYTDKHQTYFLQNAVGSTVKSLRLPMFDKMPILLPTLPEQQKIANTLSSLDNLIEANSKKVEALKEHKKGLMQQMFVSEELEDE